MAINYAKIFNRRGKLQSRPIPSSTQVRNSGGGYSWEVDDWTRLDRFLILGAEGGTYYIGERNLVKQNHDALIRCIQADGIRVVNRIVEISDAGRAPKNDPAIFALALVVTHGEAQAKAHIREPGQGLPHRHTSIPFCGICERDARLGSWFAEGGRKLVCGARSSRSRVPGGEVSAARRLVARRLASTRSSEGSFATARRGIPLDAERREFARRT